MNLLYHIYSGCDCHSQGVIALLKGRCIPQRYVVSEQINSKVAQKKFEVHTFVWAHGWCQTTMSNHYLSETE